MNLQTLIVRQQAAKANEATYRAERLELELAIVAITGLKASGQKTVREGGFKITVKPNYSYSIDMKKWAEIAARFPEELHPFKMVLDETKVRHIGKDHPALYFDLTHAVTVTPLKASVYVTRGDE